MIIISIITCVLLFLYIHYKFLELIAKSIKIYFKHESTECLNCVFQFTIFYIILSCIVFVIDLMIMGSYFINTMMMFLDNLTDNRFFSLILYQYITPIFLDEELSGESIRDKWKNPVFWASVVHFLYMLLIWNEIEKYYYTEDAIHRI